MRAYCLNTSCSGFSFNEVHCLFVFVLLYLYSYLDSYVLHVRAYTYMHTYLRQPMCCAVTSLTLLSLRDLSESQPQCQASSENNMLLK